MPRPTKAQTKSDLIYTAEGLLTASIVFEDNPDVEEMALFEDQEAYEADLADDTSDLLEISALMWLEIVERMDGDGSRGSYDKIPKSVDFFSMTSLASVPDVKIFKNSDLWMRRHLYFENGEYILADKGYPSSPFTVRPFDEPEIAAASIEDKERMQAFNLRLSRIRIIVEHAFGLFKGRFPSLHGMGPHHDIEDIYRTIEALMVSHNMAIDFRDQPNDEWRIDESPDDQDNKSDGDDGPIVQDVVGAAQVPAYETDNYLREQGRMKRLALLNKLF
ncbi:DDE Tnp4 domain-containing protein [Mycena venus]|uniref:DDE Tnp4 domain-containing protein n=1 Tax=Mycena venus TaxID=2733690 RepID=A0A8H7CEE3_9AGAR|nr:DDE Tnp4 domain-containing protein [Mycena venus]